MNKINHTLQRLINLEKDARDFGFDWPNEDMIIDQVISECHEIRDASNRDHLQEEIGDLILTAISLCMFAGFEVDETLAKVHDKFARRMQALKDITHKQGLDNLQGQSMEFMLKLWDKVKSKEKIV